MTLCMRAPARWPLLFAVIGLLSACAGPGPRVTGAGASAGELDAWEAAGRLGVAAAGQGGSGSFRWRQSGDRSLIRLNGPVGIGGLQVDMEGSILRVATSDGRVLEADAAHRELANRLGADVPASSLRYWLLGLPAPGPHRWTDGDDGQRILEQDGWRIEYGAFATSGRTELPTRLTATAGDTRVRLIIDQWNLAIPR